MKLIQFCTQHKLVLANTLFQNHIRIRYKQKFSRDIVRYQIDCIIIKKSCNQIKQCKAYIDVDINNNYNLLVMKSEIKYKNIQKKTTIKKLNL